MRAQTCLNWTIKAVALTTLVASVAGCGGGGSPSAPITATNALRTLQAGDAWTYSVSGKITPAVGKSIGLRTGSYVRSIQNVPGGPGLSISEASTLIFADGTGSTTNTLSYISQDTGGNVTQNHDNRDIDGNLEVAEPPGGLTALENGIIGAQAIIPGVWNASTGISSDNSYIVFFITTAADGTVTEVPQVTNVEQYSLTVIGQENIVTPVGTFQTWKTAMTEHFVTQGTTINSTAWWAPQLGSFVKMESTETTTSGVKQVTYSLSSTTIPH